MGGGREGEKVIVGKVGMLVGLEAKAVIKTVGFAAFFVGGELDGAALIQAGDGDGAPH